MASEQEVEILIAVIAAAATLLGTAAGSFLQGVQAKRQRGWAVEDRDKQQKHDLDLRQSEVGESRFQLLRGERRELYGRVLEGVDDYISAIRDLRDTELPAIEASSVHELESSHPIAARALRAMERQRHLEAEVVLLSDHEVRDAVVVLSRALRQAFKVAVTGGDELGPVNVARDAMLGAMRRELVGPPRSS